MSESPEGETRSIGGAPIVHTVSAGETLLLISIKYYGDADLMAWKIIHRANRQIIGDDPYGIRPGMVLSIPPPLPEGGPPSSSRTEGEDFWAERKTIVHTVSKGETLQLIAVRYYGAADLMGWKLIHDANRHVIGDNPYKIKSGMVLSIPPHPP